MTTQAVFQFEQPIRRPVARATDPETSHEAALSVTLTNVERLQRAIFDILYLRDSMTDEEIFPEARRRLKDWTQVTESGARTRRSELVDMGMVRDSGKRRPTRSGRNAIVWEAV